MAKFILSPGSVLKFPWLIQVLSPTVLQVWAIMGVLCLLYTKPFIPYTSDTSPCLPASRSSRSLPWQNPSGSRPSSGIPSTNSLPLKSERPKDLEGHQHRGRLTPAKDLGDMVKLTWAQLFSHFRGRTLGSLEPGMQPLSWIRGLSGLLWSPCCQVSALLMKSSFSSDKDNLLLLRNSSIWSLFLSYVEVVMELCRSL